MSSSVSDKTVSFIYEEFVFQETPIETLADELALPPLVVRKALNDYSRRKTFRGSCMWFFGRSLLALTVLIDVGSFTTAWYLDGTPPSYVLAFVGSVIVSALLWASNEDGLNRIDRIAREIDRELLSASEEEMRTRLRAFELNRDTDFWLHPAIRDLREKKVMKVSKT